MMQLIEVGRFIEKNLTMFVALVVIASLINFLFDLYYLQSDHETHDSQRRIKIE